MIINSLMPQSEFEAERLRIGSTPAAPCPPELETYCLVCRRMVEARPCDRGRSFIPVRHFRVDLSLQDRETVMCTGTYVQGPGPGFGAEDPMAVFHGEPERKAVWTWQ